jgi:hypothetical protein
MYMTTAEHFQAAYLRADQRTVAALEQAEQEHLDEINTITTNLTAQVADLQHQLESFREAGPYTAARDEADAEHTEWKHHTSSSLNACFAQIHAAYSSPAARTIAGRTKIAQFVSRMQAAALDSQALDAIREQLRTYVAATS